jgi:hypothetical protein
MLGQKIVMHRSLPANMQCLIVSIDHAMQLTRCDGDTPRLVFQKDRLEHLLRFQLAVREVRFIAEECKEGEITIALRLALTSDPVIPWKNISMTEAERSAVGIAHALKNRPGHPDYETMQTWIEVRIPEDDIREDFFVNETLRCAGSAKSILMLLGDMHVDTVANKLEGLGHRVSVSHELIPVRRWETQDTSDG